jgi:murein DD-endopeptidase MepM/ murein hydrolase activator NlpD
MMSRFRFLLHVFLLLFCLPAPFALAQTELPTVEPTPEPEPGESPIPQVHEVVEGENLTVIAESYGITVEELQLLNNLEDGALLLVGQELIIPGGEGELIATIYTSTVGDTLHAVAEAFNTNKASLIDSNRLINPYYELPAGQTLAVISRNGSALPWQVTGTPYVVSPEETMLMVAARHNLTPAVLAAANDLPHPTYLIPGQRLRIPSEETYRDLPGGWIDVQVRPWPVVQGSTISIFVKSIRTGQPAGRLGGLPLRFVSERDGFVALAGLDAFAEPGTVTLELEGSGDRPWVPFKQALRVESGDYGIQTITIPPELSHLLDPSIRQSEDAFLETIYSSFSETQHWDGLFQIPVTNTVVTADYGDARSYNGGPADIFHTGIDFAGINGTQIAAPAAGVVVFNALLELRGLVVIIDHGLGVMTAYFHLSESFVDVGDQVVAGQLIAAGGSSGLSTGPHLHWDLRIMNVPVNGLQWTRERFP